MSFQEWEHIWTTNQKKGWTLEDVHEVQTKFLYLMEEIKLDTEEMEIRMRTLNMILTECLMTNPAPIIFKFAEIPQERIRGQQANTIIIDEKAN